MEGIYAGGGLDSRDTLRVSSQPEEVHSWHEDGLRGSEEGRRASGSHQVHRSGKCETRLISPAPSIRCFLLCSESYVSLTLSFLANLESLM